MPYPYEVLDRDHKNLIDWVDRMENALVAIVGGHGDARAWAVLREGTAFVKQDIENHLPREEEALFPMLNTFPEAVTWVDSLMADHERLRNEFKNFEPIIPAEDRYDPEVIKALDSTGRIFLALLRAHSMKEDKLVFPLVAKLSPADQEKIAKELDARK